MRTTFRCTTSRSAGVSDDTSMNGSLSYASRHGDNIVVLVRGQLLQRYPGTIVTAARWDGTSGPLTGEKQPLFKGELDSETTFVILQLTVEEAREAATTGTPFYVMLAEHPTEPRFLCVASAEEAGNATSALTAGARFHPPQRFALPVGTSRQELEYAHLLR